MGNGGLNGDMVAQVVLVLQVQVPIRIRPQPNICCTNSHQADNIGAFAGAFSDDVSAETIAQHVGVIAQTAVEVVCSVSAI
ncbi:hypothetical protein D3C77_713320 [compost metagenome]